MGVIKSVDDTSVTMSSGELSGDLAGRLDAMVAEGLPRRMIDSLLSRYSHQSLHRALSGQSMSTLLATPLLPLLYVWSLPDARKTIDGLPVLEQLRRQHPGQVGAEWHTLKRFLLLLRDNRLSGKAPTDDVIDSYSPVYLRYLMTEAHAHALSGRLAKAEALLAELCAIARCADYAYMFALGSFYRGLVAGLRGDGLHGQEQVEVLRDYLRAHRDNLPAGTDELLLLLPTGQLPGGAAAGLYLPDRGSLLTLMHCRARAQGLMHCGDWLLAARQWQVLHDAMAQMQYRWSWLGPDAQVMRALCLAVAEQSLAARQLLAGLSRGGDAHVPDQQDVLVLALAQAFVGRSTLAQEMLQALRDILVEGEAGGLLAAVDVTLSQVSGVTEESLPDDLPVAGLLPALQAWQRRQRNQGGAVLQRLTQRQQEILAALARGEPDKEIARTLGIALGTVKVHLRSVYRVLGVSNRAGAVALWMAARQQA